MGRNLPGLCPEGILPAEEFGRYPWAKVPYKGGSPRLHAILAVLRGLPADALPTAKISRKP